jgi:hypothetical protein
MNQRKIKDSWLKEYHRYTEGQESPDTFHFWVGLSMLASTLERSVWVDMSYYVLYPNLYVILVSDAAICRRTTAVRIGVKLLEKQEKPPYIFAQKITPEALIGALCEQCKIEADGTISKDSTAVVVAEELSVFLGKEAYANGLIAILTSLYDCGDEWPYQTRSRGVELAYNTCVNLIGASSPEWLRLAIPPDAVGGGFTSRIVFVYQYRSDKVIAFPKLTEVQYTAKENLIHDLSLIRRLRGAFRFSKDARVWYIKWYKGHRMALVNSVVTDGELVIRKEGILLKLAMCFSVSEDDKLVIEQRHLEMAAAALEETEKFMPETLRILSSTPMGMDATKILTIIRRYKRGVKHAELASRVYHSIDSQRLKEIITTLGEAQIIEIRTGLLKGVTSYHYKPPRKGVHITDEFKEPE